MNKYFKNFILCGDIDHHCLLCKESFQLIDDLEKHIRWEKHRKLIKSQSCMPKFKKDSIYKIDEKCYYCECCNCVLPIIAEISQHIEEAKHKENKANPLGEERGTVCKRESGLIVIEKIKVTNKEWNGVVDSKCILCDATVDNIVKHISTSSHMINLIKCEICKSDGDQYYRKINKEISYCFMCKNTFPTQSVTDHWMESQHVEKTKVKNGDTEDSSKDRNFDIAIKLINSQKDFFDIDLENKVAMCKICTAYVNINFQFLIEHKKTHKITDKDKIEPVHVDMEQVIETLKLRKNDFSENLHLFIFDHGKKRSELAKFGRSNFIKLVPPGGKGYCSLCNIYMSAHMNVFKEHVKGQVHMGHLELKGLDKSTKPHSKPSHKTKPLKDYIKRITHSSELKVLLINKQYCLDVFSFMLVAIDEHSGKRMLKCYACDTIYDHDKEKIHCQTEQHKQCILNSKVLTTIKDEFVREIKLNLYHCATCNMVYPFWETMEKHLRSWKHVFTRNDKNEMNKLTEQWYYSACSVLYLNEEVYSYLLGLGIL